MDDLQNLYHKLQELLPDYVFGTISEEDKIFFEAHYLDYPDLIQEVKDAKAFFTRLEKMDFKRILADHTRNVSVGVNERLDKSRVRNKRMPFVSKILFPSVGLLVVVFFAWNLFFSQKDTIIHIDQAGVERLNNPVFSDDFENDENFEDYSIYQNQLNVSLKSVFDFLDDDDNELLNDYDETLELAYNHSPDMFWGAGKSSQVSIVNEIKNMSEVEFQELLEELQNNENILF